MSNAAIQAAIAAAAAQSPNMNEAQKGGGGEYTPPKAGPCLVTLVSYIELGVQHVPASQFDPIKFPAHDEEQVDLVFEIHGKGHEPKELEDGRKIPERITVTLKKSLNEKAWFYRIFKALNYDGTATHFAQLVGKHFKATIVHSVPKKEGGKVYAGFKDKTTGYTFAPPTYNPIDPETQLPDMNEVRVFPKPTPITELKVFLWDYASREMWDSLYIDGQWDEKKNDKGEVIYPAKSKNVIQNKIKGAVNFQGSPIAEILGDEVLNLDEMQGAALDQSQAEPDDIDLLDQTADRVAKQDAKPVTQTSQAAADDALADLMI